MTKQQMDETVRTMNETRLVERYDDAMKNAAELITKACSELMWAKAAAKKANNPLAVDDLNEQIKTLQKLARYIAKQ